MKENKYDDAVPGQFLWRGTQFPGLPLREGARAADLGEDNYSLVGLIEPHDT